MSSAAGGGEIEVLAVARAVHRRGVGRALIETVEHELARTGTGVVQVETLGPSHPSPEYAAGTIWPDDPCLVMVTQLGCGS